MRMCEKYLKNSYNLFYQTPAALSRTTAVRNVGLRLPQLLPLPSCLQFILGAVNNAEIPLEMLF